TLAGTLNVTLTNNFQPITNSSFTFLTCGSRSGSFGTFFHSANSIEMQLAYSDTNVSIQVTDVPITPPLVLPNKIAAIGNTTAFSVALPGVEFFAYQWTFNGANLVGQTNATLVLTNLQP